VRTGIALMAFGFVVARFALFLRRLVPSAPSSGASLDPAAGAVLTVAGSALVAAAAWRQRKRWQAMAQGKGLIMDVRWDLALAAFVAVTGLALAAYLVTREHGAWP
jgi:putative membrane protein